MKAKKLTTFTNAECCRRYQKKHSDRINKKRREQYSRMRAALKLVESSSGISS